MRFDLRNVGVKTKTIKNVVAGVEKKQNGPSWGSDCCPKNGQKYWYLQRFVTNVGLKPLF